MSPDSVQKEAKVFTEAQPLLAKRFEGGLPHAECLIGDWVAESRKPGS